MAPFSTRSSGKLSFMCVQAVIKIKFIGFLGYLFQHSMKYKDKVYGGLKAPGE